MGTCYFVNSTRQSHASATAWCESHQAELYKGVNALVNEFVLQTCALRPCWIGLQRSPEGKWSWADASELRWSQWDTLEPTGSNPYATMHKVQGNYKAGYWSSLRGDPTD